MLQLWLAPLRPGGSWLVLKVLPLLLPLRRLALALLGRFSWLRAVSLSAMSDGPCRLRWP